ncbi:hypothetical protein POSPLADRAFT_1059296 [Postia placenta MAD-698-R-SB12]|uniref:Uncharacterized protein n=1 Tax=Postia placenta MAD-698-R-SB12 TaxID=670580 RepID=A0A1X6MUY1_9APHY|nr:hypothetical protein POSPLADRAFT_1059296 [Postia placenta MAD-698-R-SB12]OSX60003.1 hypothetical protein POSPLADRAFT_1059296 [Postia placenta MAD-698-R-SB12]
MPLHQASPNPPSVTGTTASPSHVSCPAAHTAHYELARAPSAVPRPPATRTHGAHMATPSLYLAASRESRARVDQTRGSSFPPCPPPSQEARIRSPHEDCSRRLPLNPALPRSSPHPRLIPAPCPIPSHAPRRPLVLRASSLPPCPTHRPPAFLTSTSPNFPWPLIITSLTASESPASSSRALSPSPFGPFVITPDQHCHGPPNTGPVRSFLS